MNFVTIENYKDYDQYIFMTRISNFFKRYQNEVFKVFEKSEALLSNSY